MLPAAIQPTWSALIIIKSEGILTPRKIYLNRIAVA
jgi:hypothetical protein